MKATPRTGHGCKNFVFPAVLSILLFAFSRVAAPQSASGITVDDDFPGGNIVVESIDGNTIYLHQDLNDTQRNWFYWYFRVRGAAGKTLRFEFTHPWGERLKPIIPIGVHGPAVSVDKGKTWRWIGADAVQGRSFSYSFDKGQNEVRFSFGMPYTESNFNAFIAPYREHPNLDIGALAITRGGRSVERLHIGSINGDAAHRIVIVARNHASEMMTSYVLEGIIRHILEDQNEGAWFRENVEALIVPFMDKDGVELGEQGKYRRGRDHNGDYGGESIYASTAALRKYVPVWARGKLVAGIDLHCPYISGGSHETIHQVGASDIAIWKEQQALSALLEQVTKNSPIRFYAANDLPFGTDWNQASTGRFRDWIATIKGLKLATTLEFPYANASGRVVTAETARRFGEDLSIALTRYLQGLSTKRANQANEPAQPALPVASISGSAE